MSTTRILAVFLGLGLCIVVYMLLVPAGGLPLNEKVNENTFVQLKRDMRAADVAALLGKPHHVGCGQRVRVERPKKMESEFAIDSAEDGDILHVYDGLHEEQIRVLLSASHHQLIAAEYCVDGLPVYYIGKKDGNCPSRPVILASGTKNWNEVTEPRTLARRETLVKYFDQFFSITSPLLTPGPRSETNPVVARPSTSLPPTPASTAPVPAPPAPQPPAPVVESPPEKKPDEGWADIVLPSGRKLLKLAAEVPQTWNTTIFTAQESVLVGAYPNDAVWAVVAVKNGKLQGPAVGLYPNGDLCTLTKYEQNELTGRLRLWNEEHQIVLIGEYTKGRRHGVFGFFDGGRPALVQEWWGDKLQAEYLVSFDQGQQRVAAESDSSVDANRAYALRSALNTLYGTLAENERELKALARKDHAKLKAQKRPLIPPQPVVGKPLPAVPWATPAQLETYWRAALSKAASCTGGG